MPRTVSVERRSTEEMTADKRVMEDKIGAMMFQKSVYEENERLSRSVEFQEESEYLCLSLEHKAPQFNIN